MDMQNKLFKLKEMPNLYFNKNPNLTIGKFYKVKDINGSCFIIDDDKNEEIELGSSRFES